MRFDKRLVALMAVIVLLVSALAGGLILAREPLHAYAAQGDVDDVEDEAEGADVPITGDALDRASAAALEYTGGGRVTGTEVGDEEGYYEIEITLDNGRQVDVHLDENFNVLGQEADGDESGD